MTVQENPGGELFEALAEAAGRMSALPKDQENEQQRFAFRSIDAIVGHAKPILKDLGIAIIPTGAVASYEAVTSGKGTQGWRCTCRATYIVGHKSGKFITAGMIGEAIDYGDKSTTKAAQMAYKYLLTELLGIGSDDPDGMSPQAEAMAQNPEEEVSKQDQIALRINAVKASIYEASGDDASAAQSVWDGLLDGLKIKEDSIGEKRIETIEKAWEEQE